MATIRKRTWTTAAGEVRERWQVDFVDQSGRRTHKQFRLKREADAELVKIRAQVAAGTYTPESTSATIGEAIGAWLERAAAEGLERATVQQYEQLAGHIRALMRDDPKLAKLTTARVEQFRDAALQRHGRTMARKTLGALKGVLKDAKRRGLVAQNVASETVIGASGRHRKRLEVGVDVPTPAEVRAMLDAASPKAKAMVALAALAGLRASELRALRWSDISLSAHPTVTVGQRADRWGTIGSPKSATSRRTVPLGEIAGRALKEWRLAQPPGRTLVFGTGSGKPDLLPNLQRRLLSPLQVTLGIAEPVLGDDGEPVRKLVKGPRGKPVLDADGAPQMRVVMQGRYSWHALRHYAVSSWLASGIDLKTAQAWAGHATLALTLDTYGHLIPRRDDHQRLAAVENALLG